MVLAGGDSNSLATLAALSALAFGLMTEAHGYY